jgi:hypothetical protein
MRKDPRFRSINRDNRLSSNLRDTNPDVLSVRLVKNKINHLEFRPELFQDKTIRKIKKLLDD